MNNIVNKVSYLILISALSLINSCVAGIPGNGLLKTENITFSEFNSINAGGIFIIDVQTQKEQNITISGDENIIPLIDLKVVNKELIVETKNKSSINPKLELKLTINIKELKSVNASGLSKFYINNLKSEGISIRETDASRVTLSGETSQIDIDNSGTSFLDGEQLKISGAEKSTNLKLSGMGEINLTNINNDSLNAYITDSSKLRLKGNTKTLKYSSSGMSNLEAKDFNAEKAEISLSDSSSASLSVKESLNVEASGISKFEYYGAPKINQKISGNSSIKKMNP